MLTSTLRKTVPKLFDIVSMATSNIYQHHGMFRQIHPFHKSFLYRIKVAVYPTRSALPIATHVMIELMAQGRVSNNVFKHARFYVERKLVRSSFYI
jgi:hypothetical protein